ncbi:hypothetical protein Tco_0640408 [Tanacetum coccineum]
MSLANQKATTEYQEAIQATEDLETPAVGFAKTSDYKGGLAVQVNVVIKQNNTLLYLATKQSQKLVELEEKFDKLKQEIHTIVEKEVQPADLEDSISSLTKRLNSFSISGKLARTARRVFGRNNYNRTLEAAVDPERQLEISRERRANLVPAEHIHLGIFMIRLHTLHRRSAETNALVVLRDTRWEDSRQIIATMEEDLSAGTRLVYTFPDMILSVNDFHNHVEVAIQTHGYDTWQGGKSNLLITMALTCMLSNISYMGFQYSVENVMDHLSTTGITAIPGERRSIEELERMSWHLKPPEQTSVRIPSRVAVNKRLNRSTKNTSYESAYKLRKKNISLMTQRSREKWSTLGEPSGKWDYYVKYDAPSDTTPIEEIAVTERLAQNQQEFLDEYLPQWDEHLAIQKQELEWENPFAAKHDLNDSSVYSISKGEGDTHQSIRVMVQDTPVEETVFMAIKEDDEIDSDEEANQSRHYAFMFHPGPPTKIVKMVQAVGSWKPNKELPPKSKEVSNE